LPAKFEIYNYALKGKEKQEYSIALGRTCKDYNNNTMHMIYNATRRLVEKVDTLSSCSTIAA